MEFFFPYQNQQGFQYDINQQLQKITKMIDMRNILSIKNNKWPSFSHFETHNFLLKRFGIITALLTFCSLFTIYPDLLAAIWPILYRNIDEIPLYILTIVFVNTSIMFVYSVFMYFVYKGKYAFFEQYRASAELWPWQTDYKNWKKLLRKTIINILINSFIVGPIILILDSSNGLKVKMKMSDIPQSKFTYLWQFCIFLIANQIWSYLMHALIHHPKFYWIHKPHHQYSIPISISGLYVHPIQYIISSSISTGIGYKILSNFYPVHIFSLIIWLTFSMIQINDSHAGYNWPWTMTSLLPFHIEENYHYFHHRVNLGNYSGILYFMDSLFGTNAEYWKYEEKIKQKYQDKNKIAYGKDS